jgi:MFS family permease
MAGILIWGVSSFGGAIIGGYTPLLIGRMGLGLGQAAFAIFAPVVIAELFPQSKRGPAVTFFYIAISLGCAAGYWTGGFLGTRFGWQYPLIVIGIGVLTLRLPLRLTIGFRPDAGRTAVSPDRQNRNSAPVAAEPGESGPHNLRGVGRQLVRNRLYVLVTLGMAAAVFGLNGLAFWMPTFYHKVRGLPLEKANAYFGGCTACAGVAGTVIGGWLAERAQERRLHPANCYGYFLVSGVGMILVVPFAFLAILATDVEIYLPALFVAEVALFLYMGPSNTILLNVLSPSVRATGFALNILVMHMLGSVPVTMIMGEVWDLTGKGITAALVPILAFVVAGVFFLVQPVALNKDTARGRT